MDKGRGRQDTRGRNLLLLSFKVLQLISSMYTVIRGTMSGQQGSGSNWVEYLRLRIQWMREGAMSMRGRVKSADRQRWSCKSSLTSCRTHSDSRVALLHSLDLLKDSASTVPFSASLCCRGARFNM